MGTLANKIGDILFSTQIKQWTSVFPDGVLVNNWWDMWVRFSLIQMWTFHPNFSRTSSKLAWSPVGLLRKPGPTANSSAGAASSAKRLSPGRARRLETLQVQNLTWIPKNSQKLGFGPLEDDFPLGQSRVPWGFQIRLRSVDWEIMWQACNMLGYLFHRLKACSSLHEVGTDKQKRWRGKI